MTKSGDDQRPGLTISVYTVNATTLERGPAVQRTLPAVDNPMETDRFPPCACPRCCSQGFQ